MSKPGAADEGVNDDGIDLEEFPAFPDLTMPFLGGINVTGNCHALRQVTKSLTPLFMQISWPTQISTASNFFL